MSQDFSELVAVLEPNQLVSGLIGVQQNLPAGSAMVLQVDFISRPDDINSIVDNLNIALQNTNIARTDGQQIVSSDAVLPRIYISTVYEPSTITAINQLVSTQQWQAILPIILIIGVIAFIPAISSIMNSIVDIMMMFMMIYIMSSMMKSFSPTAKSINEGQNKIIRKGVQIGKTVITRGKSLGKKIVNVSPEGEVEESWYRGI